MSRWDILLDRTNQAKIKTDYVNEVNKENEKNEIGSNICWVSIGVYF